MARRRKLELYWVILYILGTLFGMAAGIGVMSLHQRAADSQPRVAPRVEEPQTLIKEPADPGGYSGPEAVFSGYLGVHNNRIAVFEGEPPHGTLQLVTEYEVRDDLREQLEAGVPFTDTYDLLRLLENYTS